LTAGLNIKVNIWRINNDPDDSIGGAMLTGTLLYQIIEARMEQTRPSLLLLQQGYETNKVFMFVLRPANLAMDERDELEVAYPPIHKYYGKRFRVTSIQYPSMHPSDSRGYLIVTASRSDEAHSVV